MEYLDFDENGIYVADHDQHPDVPKRRRVHCNALYHQRIDFRTCLADEAFRQLFGFNRVHFEHLQQLVAKDMAPTTGKGNPMPLHVKVFSSLLILRGNTFHLINGATCGISHNGSHIALRQFVNCLADMKDDFINMPARWECRRTAEYNLEKYKIPFLALGIDGKIFTFATQPRFQNPPLDHEAQMQDYWNYKGKPGFTALVITDGRYIRDAILWEPGRKNDATVYMESEFNALFHTKYRPYLVAADSAFPISVALLTPYTRMETVRGAANSRKKRKFNTRLSGARTEMTENVYGRLVRMFPVLDQLRYEVEFSQKVILATMILFNIKAASTDWEDEDEYYLVPHELDDPMEIYSDIQTQNEVRQEGYNNRNNILNQMQE